MTTACPCLLLLVPLAPLVRDDFRSRQVAVVWLGALAVATWTVSWITYGLHTTLLQAGLNLSLLLLTGGGALLYLRLRKRTGGLFDRWIGTGDAVFLTVVAPFFSPAEYLWFLIVSCTAALAGSLLLRWRTIPLAGVMGIVLALFVGSKCIGIWS